MQPYSTVRYESWEGGCRRATTDTTGRLTLRDPAASAHPMLEPGNFTLLNDPDNIVTRCDVTADMDGFCALSTLVTNAYMSTS